MVDAVQYNDGVIYQHPDTDGQTTHGNNVQTHARQVHEGKGRHDGCRNGHGNDTGCDRTLQEYQQYEEGDDGTEERCLCYVGNGKLDIFCCICQHNQFHFGIIVVDFRHFRVQLVTDFYQIGSGLFVDGNHDAVVAVDDTEGITVYLFFFHTGNVAEVNERAAGRGHRQIFDVLDVLKFPHGTHLYVGGALRKGTGGQVHVFCGKHLRKLGCGQAVASQFIRVNGDADFTFHTAGQVNGCNAFDTFQTVHHVVFKHFVQCCQIHIFCRCAHVNGNGVHIHFDDDGFIGIVRQCGLCAVDDVT